MSKQTEELILVGVALLFLVKMMKGTGTLAQQQVAINQSDNALAASLASTAGSTITSIFSDFT